MFKLLFIGFLIYYAYRLFMPTDRLEDHQHNDRFDSNDTSSKDESDYIDYEEVD